ncbi:PREDICTED: thioredoxin-like protein CXXS1 [Ipomoea nil]|uniref:thioredoxin-like protein CXXS1 n=1 Tax=Ipomoea nil TaxID=35883 RepID=UPI0009010EA7|nr:PREDICTED: thioredoxin-like protein CXXS1 [Ipomoea nil]
MDAHEQQSKSRVVKVDSMQSWEFHLNQACNHGCPVVAHFTAIWCIPSVAMNPFVEEMASAHENVVFLTVDVDDVKEVAAKYEVKAMPTFLLLKDGAPIDKLVGANPEEIRKRVEGLAQSHPIPIV